MEDRNGTIEIPSSTESTPARSRRRQVLVATALALVLAIVAMALLSQGGRSSSAAAAGGRGGNVAAPVVGAAAADQPAGAGTDQPGSHNGVGPSGSNGGGAGAGNSSEADEDALEQKDNSQGYGDGGANVEEPDVPDGGQGEGDGPLQPLPGTGCKGLKEGASLLVTPDPAVLASGVMKSALSVTNCGKASVDWSALTVPSVALASKNGTLTAGSTAEVGFTIDSNAYEPGAIAFKIKVSEPGHNHYVDVQAFRPTFGKDIVAGNGQLSAGQDAGGCANSCIVKAVLTPNMTSPNLKLEVKTRTPATIRVWWAEQPPNVFLVPKAASPANSTEWTASLAPLKAATKYYLVVRATDANGKTSMASTTFTTITPYEAPGGLSNPGGPAGCAVQCITKALLSAGGSFSSKNVEMASNTPARWVVQVSAKAPTYKDGVPSITDTEATSSTAEYLTSWKTTLNNLRGSVKYHIVVRAIDDKGYSAYQVGSFTTPAEPTHDVVFTFLTVRVTHDGDSSWKNRGELSFRWGAGDTTVGSRGEEKMSDPVTVNIPRGSSGYIAKGIKGTKGVLPTVYVSASERDADGLLEFCATGTGVPHEAGSNGDCDAKWNVAKSPTTTFGDIDKLPLCTSLGLSDAWAGVHCMQLTTEDHGDDYARFSTIIAVDPVK